MKKSMILAALLLGSAAAFAPRGEKITMGMPHWVADYHSLDLHGTGAPMDWSVWTDAKYGAAGRREILTGTAVSLSDTGKIIPADGSRRTLLLISNAKEGLASDSVSGYGLVVRGNVYEDQLPGAVGGKLPDAIRGQANAFYFQSLSGTQATGGSLTPAPGTGGTTTTQPIVITSGQQVVLTDASYQVFSLTPTSQGDLTFEGDLGLGDANFMVVTGGSVLASSQGGAGDALIMEPRSVNVYGGYELLIYFVDVKPKAQRRAQADGFRFIVTPH